MTDTKTKKKLARKVCADCQELKSAQKFYKNIRMSSGLSSYCKSCGQRRGREYKANNPRQSWGIRKAKIQAEARREALREAAAANCSYCAGSDEKANKIPEEISQNEGWTHHPKDFMDVFNHCNSGKIWVLIEQLGDSDHE